MPLAFDHTVGPIIHFQEKIFFHSLDGAFDDYIITNNGLAYTGSDVSLLLNSS